MISLLLDHLWQSTLFAVAAGLFTLMLGRNSANVRHWLWFAASVKFLLPFSLLVAVGAWMAQHLAPKASIPSAYASATYAISDAVRPFSAKAPILTAPTASTFDFGTALLAIWLLGFVCLIGFWLVRWRQLRSAVKAAESLHLGTPIPVFSSNRKLEPGLIGIFKPIVLLPEGITGRLSPEEMHATLAHELSHLERKDNLTAAIHMLVEALFWFYPPVWWIGARLINEREKACDEAVVEAGSDPQTYAEGILKVCQFYLHSPLACAAGVSGADLKRRMEAIMANQASFRLSFAKKVLLVTALGFIFSAPLAFGFIGAAEVAQTLPTQEEHARMLMEQAMPRTAIAYNPRDFDKYAGYYQMSNLIAFYNVHRDGTHLFIRLTGPHDKELYPESPTKFFAKVEDAQVSFDSDSRGRVTGLVLHRGGWEYTAKKVDEAVAKSAEAAEAARFKNQTPDPAREAPLRRFLETSATGAPPFDIMSPQLADAVRKEQPARYKTLKEAGALKSLTFKGVGPGGNDIYIAAFEHANEEWRIGPISPDGKIYWIVFAAEPP
jgi:beta-lactamase regulating signal transducer with metallopeptidase domain